MWGRVPGTPLSGAGNAVPEDGLHFGPKTQPVFWHRVPCTSQWGAWHAVPDWGLLFGPEFWDPKSSLPRGVRQPFSCPVSRSKSSSSTPTPTSFHTRRRRCLDRRRQTNVKRQCVPHAEAHTSISNSPKRRRQAESRKQHARGISKQEASNKQTTAGSRESA